VRGIQLPRPTQIVLGSWQNASWMKYIQLLKSGVLMSLHLPFALFAVNDHLPFALFAVNE
jgi:hypothetical protein